MNENSEALVGESASLCRTDLCEGRRPLQGAVSGWSAQGMNPGTLPEGVRLSFWVLKKRGEDTFSIFLILK